VANICISVEIDERSPSEDEREAEAALHAPQPSTHSAGTPLDHVWQSLSLVFLF